MVCVHGRILSSCNEKTEIMKFAGKWTKLENTVLIKVTQTYNKNAACFLSSMLHSSKLSDNNQIYNLQWPQKSEIIPLVVRMEGEEQAQVTWSRNGEIGKGLRKSIQKATREEETNTIKGIYKSQESYYFIFV